MFLCSAAVSLNIHSGKNEDVSRNSKSGPLELQNLDQMPGSCQNTQIRSKTPGSGSNNPDADKKKPGSRSKCKNYLGEPFSVETPTANRKFAFLSSHF